MRIKTNDGSSVPGEVHVGCCGFPVSRSRYASLFDVVEVQQTFYQPPSPNTLKRWRKDVPDTFVFTIKAWQALTHKHTSPTWRKIKRETLVGNIENYGWLKPTRENFYAWEATLAAARALNARIIVLQTPPSLKYNEKLLKDIDEFFASITRNDILIAWEPRGDLLERRDALKKILEKHNIIHAVDPFKILPYCETGTIYFRLHGLGKGYVNYSYKYTDADLNKLKKIVISMFSKSVKEVYILFNNKYMLDDALRFKNMLV